MEFEIGTLSIILIVGLLALISIGVPMGFASGFMGAVLAVRIQIGEHAGQGAVHELIVRDLVLINVVAPNLFDDPGKFRHVRINIIRAGSFGAGREMVVADV